MTSIIKTNAEMLFDSDCDFAGYAIPDTDPVSISTKWIKTYTKRPFDDHDEAIYHVEWANGTWADMFTISNDWHQIYVNCINANFARNWAAKSKVQLADGHKVGEAA